MKNPVVIGIGALGAVALIAIVVFLVGAKGKDRTKIALNPEEETLVQLTNQARRDNGLPELKFDPDLVAVARAHSHYMKLERKLCFPVGGLNRALGAVGFNAEAWGMTIDMVNGISIERAFENALKAEQTKKEILGNMYDVLGVGVTEVEEHPGVYFLTLVFAKKKL